MVKYILILFLLINHCLAGTIDPNTSDEKYLKYAQEFECVGTITGKSENGSNYFASAVAIDSQHILTAAHVVKDCKTCFFEIGGRKYNIYKVIYSQKYDNGFGVGDIAIGFSEQKLQIESYPQLYSDNDEKGKLCSISGFGMTGTFLTGPNIGDTKQRAGTNMIDTIDSELLVCSPTKGKNKTKLEFLIASGDSGGGLFIDGKLAGINSCIFVSKGSPNSKYGTESGHTRVSIYRNWILENTKN